MTPLLTGTNYLTLPNITTIERLLLVPLDGTLVYDSDLKDIFKFTNGAWSSLAQLSNPSWVKITKTFSDFAIPSLTNDIEIYSLPAGAIIQGVLIKAKIPFQGGLMTAYTISVGTVISLIKYASAFDVYQPVGDTTFQLSNNFDIQNWGMPTSIRAGAISVGDLLDSATMGVVEFYILTSIVKS